MAQPPTVKSTDETISPRRMSEHTGPSSTPLLLAPQPPSPFPSPSSSFVPPPAQHPHEFANKTTARMAAAKQPRSATHSRHNSEDSKPTTSSPLPQPSPKLADQNHSPHPILTSLQPLTPKRFSAESAQSLSSSRPAPASPALSRHSSLLHTGSRKRLSTMSIVSTPPIEPPPRAVVKIRDFAFPPNDERHIGNGPLSKRSSTISSHSSSSGNPWGSQSQSPDPGSDSPDDESGEEDIDAFLPGTYRALYAFEPEGTAEMALAEDQHVRVLGRGGGVGWVVVLKPNGVEQALVPEGYLELVRADVDGDGDDSDERDDEESVGGATEAPRTPRALS